MANELSKHHTTGLVLYAVISNASNKYWYTVTPVFETYNASHWTSYGISMTENGASGDYVGTFPTGITSAGIYIVRVRVRAGGSAATSDTVVAEWDLGWTGSAEAPGTITPASDPLTTSAYLTTYDVHGAALAGVDITFKALTPPDDDGASHSGDEFTATSSGTGGNNLSVTLLRDTEYLAWRGNAHRKVNFTTDSNSSFQLPAILGYDTD